jgi:ATP-dependent RNA helicase DeaD
MTPDPSDTTSALPTFDDLPLSKELRQAIDELGYTHPTPVQREVFEPASRGKDLVVQARTGTGKTASFGMPVVDALVQRSLSAVQVVILCPTRELALQVHRELDTLGKYRGIRSVAVYGGAPMGRQVEELANGAQVLVGTPGRVLDHLGRGSLNPKNVKAFILDESDEMLSMGFLPQINEIRTYLPQVHQTLLFSATLPPDIQRYAENHLKDPVFLTLSGDQIGALDIQHLVYFTRGDKLKDFEQIIEVENPESAIVFCNTRDETKRVAGHLEKLGFDANWLNADLAQNEREQVMAATRESRLRFLVCTDVAARGIDISHLTHVINYDLPESAESYVHRTGRTGRAGRTGTAISLIEPSDIGNLYMLRLTYKIFPIERQLPSAGELKTRKELDLVEVFQDAFAKRNIHPDDLSLARRLLTHDNAERIVAALLRDHLGARPEVISEASEARRAKNPPSLSSKPRESGSGNKSSKGRTQPSEVVLSPPVPKAETTSSVQASPQAPEKPQRERRSRRSEPPRDRPSPESTSRAPERGRRTYRDDDFEFGYSVSEAPSDVIDTFGTQGEPPLGEGTPSIDLPNQTPSVETGEVFINVGRRDGARTRDFAALLESAGLSQRDILQINVRPNNTFVRVLIDTFDRAISTLNGATICGKTAFAEASRSTRS